MRTWTGLNSYHEGKPGAGRSMVKFLGDQFQFKRKNRWRGADDFFLEKSLGIH